MTSTTICLFVLLLVIVCCMANEDEFFLRSAKWANKNLNPVGGSLISGRGRFRPGFYSNDWRAAMAEPSFVKRSSPSNFDY
ncbi:unnamed protein product [Caenorhabditis angaria]|uniref:Uncharacterized protein n=1 Tax=Caenorhabditis angaria TaxID=860376 RepID=A0A9P1N2G5_9PELO|nr:unnamed protein product [Caenorhabditis angaria]